VQSTPAGIDCPRACTATFPGVARQADGTEVAVAGGVVKVPVGDDGVGEDVAAEEDLPVDFERAGLIERERLAGVGSRPMPSLSVAVAGVSQWT
jgi:hypothetical protein